MQEKQMIVRRYRVGVDIGKYTRNFIIGCVMSAAITLAAASVILLMLFQIKWEQMTTYYEGEISALNETLTNIEAEHQRELDELNAKHEAEVAELKNNLEELDELYTNLNNAKAADFDFYKDYWYVFRDAPANSGISLELIRFVDEKCQEWDVNPQWMWAIYDLETGFDTNLDNAAGSGARGLGQVMPSTGKEIWERILGHGAGSYTHRMAYDPFVNAEITVTHIGRNIAIGSMSNAIQLYSGGGGQSYWSIVIDKGKNHGVTLTEANAHYPWTTK